MSLDRNDKLNQVRSDIVEGLKKYDRILTTSAEFKITFKAIYLEESDTVHIVPHIVALGKIENNKPEITSLLNEVVSKGLEHVIVSVKKHNGNHLFKKELERANDFVSSVWYRYLKK